MQFLLLYFLHLTKFLSSISFAGKSASRFSQLQLEPNPQLQRRTQRQCRPAMRSTAALSGQWPVLADNSFLGTATATTAAASSCPRRSLLQRPLFPKNLKLRFHEEEEKQGQCPHCQ